LLAAFLGALAGPALAEGRVDQPALVRELEERIAAAAAMWPGVHLDPPGFAAYLGARVYAPGQDAVAVAAMFVDDLYLACACARADPEALRIFDRCILDRIDGFVRRFDASAAFADEVRQVLRRRLLVAEPPRCAKIEEYSGRGALAAWVGVAAQRTAVSLLRVGRVAAGASSEDALEGKISQDPDPELEYARSRYRTDFHEALRLALAALPDEDRALLRLYYVGGLSLQKLAQIKQVSFATVSRRLARARAAIGNHMKRTLEARLHLTPTEFASLARLVRSSLEPSIFRMLHGNGGA
jgi:RNA polymerase sigma-70 factor, ECF subfamily